MQIPLSLIQTQLAFDSAQEVHDFLAANHAALYKPTAAGAAAPPLEEQQLDCKKALGPLSEVLESAQKADLKGQI